MKTAEILGVCLAAGGALGLLSWIVTVLMVPNAVFRRDSNQALVFWPSYFWRMLVQPFHPVEWWNYWTWPSCMPLNVYITVIVGLLLGSIAAAIWVAIKRSKQGVASKDRKL
jgi:hypothetical protein